MTVRRSIPLTSRVWFFPALILLMPLLSRACTNAVYEPPARRELASHAQGICLDEYYACLDLCPGDPNDQILTPAEQECIDACYTEYVLCLEYAGEPPPDDPEVAWCDYSPEFSCDWSDSDDYYDDSSGGEGWDCSSSDNYDEGDSGDDSEDWGEDWGERSPAGGDGVATPSDLPH